MDIKDDDLSNVIDLANEIISNNIPLKVNKLYSQARRRLHIPRRRLLFIIDYLIKNKIFVEGSKLTKETVLKHHFRKILIEIINQNIGIHFSAIKEELSKLKSLNKEDNNVSSGKVIWHIEILLKFDIIKKVKYGLYSVFIPKDIDEEIAFLCFLRRDKITDKILHNFLANEELIQSEIHKTINEQREKVYYRVNNLLSKGILKYKTESKKKLILEPHKKEALIEIDNNPIKRITGGQIVNGS